MNMSFIHCCSKLKYVNPKNYSNIIIEHAPNLWIQIYLFFKFGKIIYRSHNAEFLHRLHILFCNLNHFFSGILLIIRKNLQKFNQGFLCDFYYLSISCCEIFF